MMDDENRGWTNGGWFDSHVYDKYDNYDADGDGDASMIRRCLHVMLPLKNAASAGSTQGRAK